MRAVYPKYLEALISGAANSALNGNVKAALLRSGGYTYSAENWFYTSVLSAVVGIPQPINGKNYSNGVFSGQQVDFLDITNESIGSFVIFIDTGTPATSRLVMYDDEATGFVMLADGGMLSIAFDSSGIIAF